MLADRIVAHGIVSALVSCLVCMVAVRPVEVGVAQIQLASRSEPLELQVREVQHVTEPAKRRDVLCRYPVSRMFGRGGGSESKTP